MTITERPTTTDATTTPTMHGGLANLDDEFSYWVGDVEGTVPHNLRGTFYRNGPGRQRIGGTPYGHWFDGCGMLSAFSIYDQKVHFANKYVRTPKYIQETRTQQISYRGFGTQIPGGLRKNVARLPGNPSNTNLVHQGGRILTMYEGGHPFEVDPTSLETVGEHNFDGALKRSMVFSAHGHVHHRSGDWFNFGAGNMGFDRNGPKNCFNLFRIDRSGKMADLAQFPIDRFPFAHDFIVSDQYAIFFVNSILMGSIAPMILGTRTIADGVSFDNNAAMQVIVVDLDTMTEVTRLETDPGAIIHFANAFEDGDTLIIDAMHSDNFEANDALKDIFNAECLRGGEYRRYTINITTGSLAYEVMSPTNSEFPTFNQTKAGQRHQATYMASSVENGHNSFFNAIQRVSFDGDIQLHTLEPGLFGSEPVFAPAVDSSDDADGYLLEVVYDAWKHLSQLWIFRAADIAEPIAKLTLRHHLPHQFHGFWHNDVELKYALP